MLIGNTYDSITPLSFSQEMNAEIPNSMLVTWTGPGHAVYLGNEMPGTCVKNQVDNYLLNLTPPDQPLCEDVINPTS